mmetsp:Transcript_24562/g.52928  ORF Transcript_24562/g.52928 Transcript_24562/m.52928 type:complete len:215 (-) Transcript_24562:1759-2403(-)
MYPMRRQTPRPWSCSIPPSSYTMGPRLPSSDGSCCHCTLPLFWARLLRSFRISFVRIPAPPRRRMSGARFPCTLPLRGWMSIPRARRWYCNCLGRIPTRSNLRIARDAILQNLPSWLGQGRRSRNSARIVMVALRAAAVMAAATTMINPSSPSRASRDDLAKCCADPRVPTLSTNAKRRRRRTRRRAAPFWDWLPPRAWMVELAMMKQWRTMPP